MEPYYQDNHIDHYCMDFRKNDLPDECVQMVCTSPPYWGLRKYSGDQDLIWGDKKDCLHDWGNYITPPNSKSGKHGGKILGRDYSDAQDSVRFSETGFGCYCSLCGSWRGAYGLEPTPEIYVQHTVEILRHIRRVLRKDGVVFWNIGDSYAAGGGTQVVQTKNASHGLAGYRQKTPTVKPKDLCLVPFRVAIAAQTDGWWVRSVIIWAKPNPMPESVTDRPTESHEYILMLTKSAKYYWDADAVREKLSPSTMPRMMRGVSDNHKNVNGAPGQTPHTMSQPREHGEGYGNINPVGHNIRSVWEFPTQPYPEAHFAVFPEKIPETCIKAATPEAGCCSKCGSPWERIVEHKNMVINKTEGYADASGNRTATAGTMVSPSETKTLSWQPTCKCNADKVPSIVLDPFAGSGTTLWVAKKLNRKAIGFDTSEEYSQLLVERNRQQVFGLKC